MARYLVLERSFINSVLVDAGTEIEYDGQPDRNLQPLDDAGKAAAQNRVADLLAKKVAADARAKLVASIKNDPNFDDLI